MLWLIAVDILLVAIVVAFVTLEWRRDRREEEEERERWRSPYSPSTQQKGKPLS